MSSFSFSGNNQFNSAAAFGDHAQASSVHHGGSLDPAAIERLTRAVAELRGLLERHPAAVREPAAARADVDVVDAELVSAEPDGQVVRSRLASLADQVAPLSVLADAVARISEAAMRLWPQ
jgi:hypothetical protein